MSEWRGRNDMILGSGKTLKPTTKKAEKEAGQTSAMFLLQFGFLIDLLFKDDGDKDFTTESAFKLAHEYLYPTRKKKATSKTTTTKKKTISKKSTTKISKNKSKTTRSSIIK